MTDSSPYETALDRLGFSRNPIAALKVRTVPFVDQTDRPQIIERENGRTAVSPSITGKL